MKEKHLILNLSSLYKEIQKILIYLMHNLKFLKAKLLIKKKYLFI